VTPATLLAGLVFVLAGVGSGLVASALASAAIRRFERR
jgi:F0F1-type ATP synthase membrane subunit c/vacuolar-type H+-ATPase subunit K